MIFSICTSVVLHYLWLYGAGHPRCKIVFPWYTKFEVDWTIGNRINIHCVIEIPISPLFGLEAKNKENTVYLYLYTQDIRKYAKHESETLPRVKTYCVYMITTSPVH